MILNVYAKVLKTSVHEKNMGKNFQTKKSIIAKMIVQCKQIFRQNIFFLLLTVIPCTQRYTNTSVPCNVAVVDLK
jgi:hypothetical protein